MQTSAVALEASAFYWREFNIIHCKKVNQTGRKCENPKVQRINLKLINSSKIRWKGCKSKVTLNFSFEVHQQDNLTNPRGYFEHIILCGNVRLLHITAAALAYLIYITLSVLVSSQHHLSELGHTVDWWTEGVCLPVIAIIGICGE